MKKSLLSRLQQSADPDNNQQQVSESKVVAVGELAEWQTRTIKYTSPKRFSLFDWLSEQRGEWSEITDSVRVRYARMREV